jgi:hypothetical protein
VTEPPNTEALLATVRGLLDRIPNANQRSQHDMLYELARILPRALDAIASERRLVGTALREQTERAEAAEAALDAIASELEQAREDYEAQREYADEQYRKALAAEAELERREQLFNAFRDADERTITEQRVELERLRLSMDARQQEVDEFRVVHGVMTQDWKNAVRARDDWADRATRRTPHRAQPEAAEAELKRAEIEESLTRNEWETIHENLKCKDS